MAGDLESHDWLCSALAQLSHALVLSVGYRQPPEAKVLGNVTGLSFLLSFFLMLRDLRAYYDDLFFVLI